jgi:hypothetical protein
MGHVIVDAATNFSGMTLSSVGRPVHFFRFSHHPVRPVTTARHTTLPNLNLLSIFHISSLYNEKLAGIHWNKAIPVTGRGGL